MPRHFDVAVLQAPASATGDPVTSTAGWIVLGVLLAGCFAAEPANIPLSAVAGFGAVILTIAASRRPTSSLAPQQSSGPHKVCPHR
ncbi:ArsB/NhaD family transporter [Arthrobacter sp. MDB2-24]